MPRRNSKLPTTFTVTGRGKFPIDMLRYNACTPRTSQDSAAIEASIVEPYYEAGRNNPQLRSIQLVIAPGYPDPTAERWRSYRWEVSNVHQ